MKRRKQKKKIIKSNLSKIGIVLSFESFEEEIFRRKRERGEKRSIIENGRSMMEWKMIEAQLILWSAIWKSGPKIFFPPSLSISLSLCVCVIDRSKCGLKILNTYDEFYYEASLLCTGRWRKSDGAVVSVVRGGVRRVSWLCFFSEPVRHPSRRSAGH